MADIKAARAAGADFVIVMPHWGTEYTQYVSPVQRREAAAMVAAGADVILGSHSHYVGAIQSFAKPSGDPAFVVYSLGDLLFDFNYDEQTQEGVVDELTFEGTRLAQIDLYPTVMVDDAQPNLLDPAGDGKRVLDRIRAASAKRRPVRRVIRPASPVEGVAVQAHRRLAVGPWLYDGQIHAHRQPRQCDAVREAAGFQQPAQPGPQLGALAMVERLLRQPNSRDRRHRTSTTTSRSGGPGSTATMSSSLRPAWTLRPRTRQPRAARRSATRLSAASPACCPVRSTALRRTSLSHQISPLSPCRYPNSLEGDE